MPRLRLNNGLKSLKLPKRLTLHLNSFRRLLRISQTAHVKSTLNFRMN